MIDSYVVYDEMRHTFLQRNGTFGRGCSARTFGRKSDARNSMNYKGLYDLKYRIVKVVGLVAALHDDKDKFMDTSALTAADAVDMLQRYYEPEDKVIVGVEVEADCVALSDSPLVVEEVRYHNNRYRA